MRENIALHLFLHMCLISRQEEAGSSFQKVVAIQILATITAKSRL